MLIAIDFDDTYTKDPYLWNDFLKKCKLRNHEVICVTMRFEEEGEMLQHTIAHFVDKIYFTERQAKKPFLEKMNIKPDIWIDDSPHWILTDA